MRLFLPILLVLLLFGAGSVRAANCCAPPVTPQGVMGETVALPHTLEFGLHYEYLRSEGSVKGTEPVDDDGDRRTIFKRTTLSLAYGLTSRWSVTVLTPYVWKEKSQWLSALQSRHTWESDDIGDITALVRFSPIARSWVNFRELSVAVGVKAPTGPTDKVQDYAILAEELQPGSGSWDWLGSVSYYQGFELVDFFVSGTYIATGEYESYQFGDQFSYLLSSSYHLHERVDLSLGLSGVRRACDTDQRIGGDDKTVDDTGRHQLFVVSGVQAVVLPPYLRLQAFFEAPIWEEFTGIQLKSDWNLRFSLTYMLELVGGEEE